MLTFYISWCVCVVCASWTTMEQERRPTHHVNTPKFPNFPVIPKFPPPPLSPPLLVLLVIPIAFVPYNCAVCFPTSSFPSPSFSPPPPPPHIFLQITCSSFTQHPTTFPVHTSLSPLYLPFPPEGGGERVGGGGGGTQNTNTGGGETSTTPRKKIEAINNISHSILLLLLLLCHRHVPQLQRQ